MKRVIERTKVGVDLLRERAWQEAKALARFDRGSRQHDAIDALGLQSLHCFGHRQVGLARTGRTDAEDHRVLIDSVDVALLVHRLGPDSATAIAQNVRAEDFARTCSRAQKSDGALNRFGGECLPRTQHDEHLAHEGVDGRDVVGRPADHDLVAASEEFGVGEGALDHA